MPGSRSGSQNPGRTAPLFMKITGHQKPAYYQSHLSADYFHTIISCIIVSTSKLEILTDIS